MEYTNVKQYKYTVHTELFILRPHTPTRRAGLPVHITWWVQLRWTEWCSIYALDATAATVRSDSSHQLTDTLQLSS
jgi:hypothetical protein